MHFHVLHSMHCNWFTIDHYQYLVNIQTTYFWYMSNKWWDLQLSVLNCMVGSLTFYLGLCLTDNIYNYKDQSGQRTVIIVCRSSSEECVFCSILTKIRMCQQILLKISNMEFYKNLCCGSCAVPYQQTDWWKWIGQHSLLTPALQVHSEKWNTFFMCDSLY